MVSESLFPLLQTLPDISDAFADPDAELLPLDDIDLSQTPGVFQTPGVLALCPSLTTPPQPEK